MIVEVARLRTLWAARSMLLLGSAATEYQRFSWWWLHGLRRLFAYDIDTYRRRRIVSYAIDIERSASIDLMNIAFLLDAIRYYFRDF